MPIHVCDLDGTLLRSDGTGLTRRLREVVGSGGIVRYLLDRHALPHAAELVD